MFFSFLVISAGTTVLTIKKKTVAKTQLLSGSLRLSTVYVISSIGNHLQ